MNTAYITLMYNLENIGPISQPGRSLNQDHAIVQLGHLSSFYKYALDQWFPTRGAPEFTAGKREQIHFEVGLGDKTINIIIVI